MKHVISCAAQRFAHKTSAAIAEICTFIQRDCQICPRRWAGCRSGWRRGSYARYGCKFSALFILKITFFDDDLISFKC